MLFLFLTRSLEGLREQDLVAVGDNFSHTVALAKLLTGQEIFFMFVKTLDFDDTLLNFGLSEPQNEWNAGFESELELSL